MNSTEPTPNQAPFEQASDPAQYREFRRERFPDEAWRGRGFRGGYGRHRFRFLRFGGIVAMVLLCAVVFGYVTQHLWNWLIPSIVHLRSISFVEAIGLVVLGKILFGGIHKGGRRHFGGRRGGPGGQRWKQHMKAKFDSMTPEEREKFRSGMRGNRWCRPARPENTEGGR